MIKVAVLDDYQEVFEQIIDTSKYKEKYEFKIRRLIETKLQNVKMNGNAFH